MRRWALALTASWLAWALLCLAACGPSSAGHARGAPAAAPDRLQRIRAAGRLRVALVADAPPLAFARPGGGRLEGLEVDLAGLLARALIGPDGRVELVPTTRLGLALGLAGGEADIALGVTAAAAAPDSLHLSPPYLNTGVSLIGRRDRPHGSLRALDGARVAVVQGSGAGPAVEAAAGRAGVTIVLQPQASAAAALAAVRSGDAAALAAAGVLTPAWLLQDPQLRRWSLSVGRIGYAAAVPAGAPALAEALDRAVREIVGGRAWRALLRKWGVRAAPQPAT